MVLHVVPSLSRALNMKACHAPFIRALNAGTPVFLLAYHTAHLESRFDLLTQLYRGLKWQLKLRNPEYTADMDPFVVGLHSMLLALLLALDLILPLLLDVGRDHGFI